MSRGPTLGAGPWFVAMLTHDDMQQTKLVVHAYPELYVTALNFLAVTSSWSCHIIIGPFESVEQSTSVFNDWSKCKQRKTRIEFGNKLPSMPSLSGMSLCVWYKENEYNANRPHTAKTLHINEKSRYPYITVHDVKQIIKMRNK